MSCTTSSVYKALIHCPGTIIAPGIRSNVWFIPKDDIETWPTADVSAGNYGSAGKFTLKTGKKWYTIKGIKSQGSVESAPTGEKPCKSFDNTLNVFVPGLSADVIGWANQASNDDLVFAFQGSDGSIKIIGYEYGEVDVAPTSNTGSGSGDNKGETCAITCDMPYQPLVLVGGLTSLGDIDDGSDAA